MQKIGYARVSSSSQNPRIQKAKLDLKVRKRGGKAGKRGLSSEQVPVLVAVDRSDTTASRVLPAVNSEALKSAIERL